MQSQFEEADPIASLQGKRVLFIASTGGHLAQLVRLSKRTRVAAGSVWATFDSPQSRSLLADQDVIFLPYVAPRDVVGMLRARRILQRALRDRGIEVVVSTGAAIAISGFLWARRQHVRRIYIESFSRVQGPSLTGKLVARFALAERYTQHPLWNLPGWTPVSGVLEGFERQPRPAAPPTERPLRILVTLGTIRPYQFRSLVEAVLATGEANEHTVWQLGVTEATSLPGRAESLVPADEFSRLAHEADVVVTHSGVGTVLQLLELGVYPVIVPRRAARGEHVDDHQEQIGKYIAERGLGVFAEVGELTAGMLRTAAQWRVTARD